jgi:hypothetical protein
MAAALRKILQMIPAGNWKARFKAEPFSDKPLVCWALVEWGLPLKLWGWSSRSPPTSLPAS